MQRWLEAYKPAAPQHVHLLLAALVWNVVGTVLLLVGLYWVVRNGRQQMLALVLVALTAGAVKGRWVLVRAAGRIIERIRARGDGRCLGGFISWPNWLLVAVMIVGGRWIRTSGLPRTFVGLVYVAVGIALLMGARPLWRAWRNDRPQEGTC